MKNIKQAAELYINSSKFEDPNGHGMRGVKEAFIAGAKSEAAKEYWFKIFKQEKTLIKEKVCTSCLSPSIVDINCRCVYGNKYKTIELEFEVDCLGNINDRPADTEFNEQQLKTLE